MLRLTKGSSSVDSAYERVRSLLVTIASRHFGNPDPTSISPNCTLQDVQNELTAAAASYDERHSTLPELPLAIAAFSQRLRCYSNVIDIFVTYHSEYAVLAWTTIKLLCQSLDEQVATSLTLLANLCDIADALPRIDLSILETRTTVLDDTIGRLYAHVFTYLAQAIWSHYPVVRESGSLSSTLATYPFSDILLAIQHDAGLVQTLVSSRPLPEPAILRRIHDNRQNVTRSSGHDYGAVHISGPANVHLGDQIYYQQDVSEQLSILTTVVDRLREELAADRAVRFNISPRVKGATAQQEKKRLLNLIAQRCLLDHESSLQRLKTLCGQRSVHSRSKALPFWIFPKLQKWQESADKSLIFLKGTFNDRLALRDFSFGIIQQLQSQVTVVLYVFAEQGKTYTLQEVYKSLILQALSLSHFADIEDKMRSVVCDVYESKTDEPYLDFLLDCLERFPLVYIIANVEAIVPESILDFRKALNELSGKLASHNTATRIKILIISHTPGHTYNSAVDSQIIRIGNTQNRPQKSRARLVGINRKRPHDQPDLFAGMTKKGKRFSRR